MGVIRYKRTVDCECGCNYGSNCGRKISFLLCYNRSVDIGTLYVNNNAENTDSKYERLLSMGDEQLAALIDVLTSPVPIENVTEKEIKLI